MEAYRKVPQRMRDRLQNLTGGPERFIGGSVDTMFIPGHLREDLLDTLATFLETSCFLEIVSKRRLDCTQRETYRTILGTADNSPHDCP